MGVLFMVGVWAAALGVGVLVMVGVWAAALGVGGPLMVTVRAATDAPGANVPFMVGVWAALSPSVAGSSVPSRALPSVASASPMGFAHP
ncbi:hypothetical protein AMK26_11475 [Streptomyces sp. CB03234]|uniref:hypothetical protein n=1 Tax=Streptomyces sp. (strain CB03234) TaxID=1703937 RepID=UPI00093C73F2|nr:hypothetical protein [Streptomyces sp. CB03234]OKK06611.1 hypothetical protein AMK26_11475 [Streptomyces sp. CB03234]